MNRLRDWSHLWLMLVIFFVLPISSLSAESVKVNDIKGHAAEADIQAWLDKGIVNGYPDRTFRPNAEVTRAEFVAIINRAFRYQDKQAVEFNDLKQTDWEYGDVQKAIAYGYIAGFDDGTFRSSFLINKQQGAMILSRILKSQESLAENSPSLADEELIPAWSKHAIYSVLSNGIMLKEKDGTFAPNRPLTRAETVVAIKNAWEANAVTYDEAGMYGTNQKQHVHGDVIIDAADVTLRNMHVYGDLILTESISDGDARLERVVVEGITRIEGGGSDSIHIDDSRIGSLNINREDRSVRVVAEGSTTIGDTTVYSGAVLEEEGNGSGFGSVRIAPSSKNAQNVRDISFAGNFVKVEIDGDVRELTIRSGHIGSLKLNSRVQVNEIELHKDTTVDTLELDSKTKVTGEGSVKHTQLSGEAEGSEIAPTIQSPTGSSGVVGGPPGGGIPGGGAPGGGMPGGGVPGGGIPGGGVPGGGGTPGPVDPATATVSGTLYYRHYISPDLLPISKLRVELRGKQGTTENYHDITNHGRFSFNGVAPGTYSFTVDFGIRIYYSEDFTVVAGQKVTLPDQIIQEAAPDPFVDTIFTDIGYLNGGVFDLDERFKIKVLTEDGTQLRTWPVGEPEWSYDMSIMVDLLKYNPGLKLKDGDKLYVTFYTVTGWSETLEATIIERPLTATPIVTNVIYDDTRTIRGTLTDSYNEMKVTRMDGTVIGSYHTKNGNTFSLYINEPHKLTVGEQLLVYGQGNNMRISEPAVITVVAPTVITAQPTVPEIVYEDDVTIAGTAEAESIIAVRRSDGTIIGEGKTSAQHYGSKYTIRLTDAPIRGETLYVTAKGYEKAISEQVSIVVQTRPITETPFIEDDVYYDETVVTVHTVNGVKVELAMKEMDGTVIFTRETTTGSASFYIYYDQLQPGRQYQVTAKIGIHKESIPFVFTALMPTEKTPLPTVTSPVYAEAGSLISGLSERRAEMTLLKSDGTVLRTWDADYEGKFSTKIPSDLEIKPGDTLILRADAERKVVSDDLVITTIELSEKSRAVVVSLPIDSSAGSVAGTANPYTLVKVYKEDGTQIGSGNYADMNSGNWSLSIGSAFLRAGERIYVIAKETGKLPSDPVYITLQASSSKTNQPVITSELSAATTQIQGNYDVSQLGSNEYIAVYILRDGKVIANKGFRASEGSAFTIDLEDIQLAAGETITFIARISGKEASDPLDKTVNMD